MGLMIRRSKKIGNTTINASNSGISGSRKFGPVTVSSRGHVTLHIAKGISFRIR